MYFKQKLNKNPALIKQTTLLYNFSGYFVVLSYNKVKVYIGKETGTDEGWHQPVVMDLIGDYLDKGITLYVYKLYTYMDLIFSWPEATTLSAL